jgi:rhamnose transport system permease protein
VSVALAGLLVVLGIASPSFYHPVPLLSLIAREAPSLIVTSGIALIIIARQIDISVGSQFAVCSVCSGLLLAAHWPLVAVVAGSVAMGLAMGAINGLLVAGFQLPSIVVTLATMVTLREGLRWLRQGQFVNLPPNAQWFGFSQQQGQTTIVAVSVALFAAMAFAARNLAVGRHVYAVGSNAEAARVAGLRPRLITGGLFMLLGGLCAVAAVLNALQSPQVDPKAGSGLELKLIAASVVGGVAISGGRGTLWGSALGLALLACIGPALTHLHLEAYWERAILGLIILVAVLGDSVHILRVNPGYVRQPTT